VPDKENRPPRFLNIEHKHKLELYQKDKREVTKSKLKLILKLTSPMKNLKTTIASLLIAACIACKGNNNNSDTAINNDSASIQQAQNTAPATIQIALLLDTSNSMDGLIDQVKTQLWDIVNRMSSAHCNMQRASLEIALYEYGNSRLPDQNGFVRKVLDFSTDLDAISKELFALRTKGGDEYCGTVISKSLQQLEWRNGPNDLKIIFIAGNESFNQGNIPFSASIAQAVEKDVVVNTIFCGEWQTGTQLQWKEGATIGKGVYSTINHNEKSRYVSTPYDDEILRYNTQLNDTYIAYGSNGYVNKNTQYQMDQEVEEISAQANVKRTLAKASSNYRNSNWDLVDAIEDTTTREKALKLENRASLPNYLQDKNKEEILAFAKAKKQERTSIQNSIIALNKKRDQYIAAQSLTETNELETQLFNAIKKQAVSKNYTWDK
jgi:hypothetical protein